MDESSLSSPRSPPSGSFFSATNAFTLAISFWTRLTPVKISSFVERELQRLTKLEISVDKQSSFRVAA